MYSYEQHDESLFNSGYHLSQQMNLVSGTYLRPELNVDPIKHRVDLYFLVGTIIFF